MFIFLPLIPFFDNYITLEYKKTESFLKNPLKILLKNSLFFIYLEKNIWQIINPCS